MSVHKISFNTWLADQTLRLDDVGTIARAVRDDRGAQGLTRSQLQLRIGLVKTPAAYQQFLSAVGEWKGMHTALRVAQPAA